LVELVVCMTVGAIISGTAATLLWNASRQHSEVAARAELIDMGAAALEQVVRHVREVAQDGPPGPLNGQARVTLAGGSEVRFVRIDPVSGTEISTGFRRNGATNRLEMTMDNAVSWFPLATDVTAFTLVYYNRKDQDISLLSYPDSEAYNTRRIGMTLTLARGTETAKIRTSVFLRNFMNEVELAPPP